eukprot:gene7915-8732_t
MDVETIQWIESLKLSQYSGMLEIKGLTTLQAIITEENAVNQVANEMKGISKKKFLEAVENLKSRRARIILADGGLAEEHGEQLERNDLAVDCNYCLEGQQPLSSPLPLSVPFFRCTQCKMVIAGNSVRCVKCGNGQQGVASIPSSPFDPDQFDTVLALRSVQSRAEEQDQINDDHTLAMLYHIIEAVNDKENDAMRITLRAEGLLGEEDVVNINGSRDANDLATTAPVVHQWSDMTAVSTLTVSTAATQTSSRRKPHRLIFHCHNGKCRKLLPSFISYCPYCGTSTGCADEKQKKPKKKRRKPKPVQKLWEDTKRFFRSL